jgi:hypothetical protein
VDRRHPDGQCPILPDVDDAAQALLPDSLDGDKEAAVAALVDYNLACFGKNNAVRNLSLLSAIEHLFYRIGVLIIAQILLVSLSLN